MSNAKTKIAAIIIIVVIAAGLAFFFFRHQSANKMTKVQTAANNKPVVFPIPLPRQDIPNSQLPDNFPTNIPMEAGAPISQNYNVKFGDTEVSGRTFQTAKTQQQNLALYSNYFSANGWIPVTGSNESTASQLAVSKGDVKLEVDLTQDSTKANFVTIKAIASGQ